MNLQFALYGQVLEGFQSNPYRRVRIGPNVAAGAHPRHPRALVDVGAPQPLPAEAPRRGALRRAVLRRHVGRDRRRRRARLLAVHRQQPARCKFHARVVSAERGDASSRTRSSTRPSRPPASTSRATASSSPVRNAHGRRQAHADHVARGQAGVGPVRQARSSTSRATLLLLDLLAGRQPRRQPDGHRQRSSSTATACSTR